MNRNAGTVGHAGKARRHQQPYYLSHDFTGPADLTATLIHGIADVAGVDVRQAEAALREQVDPDALDRLFEPTTAGNGRTGGQFTVSIWGHRVTVSGSGQIAIVPQATHPSGPA